MQSPEVGLQVKSAANRVTFDYRLEENEISVSDIAARFYWHQRKGRDERVSWIADKHVARVIIEGRRPDVGVAAESGQVFLSVFRVFEREGGAALSSNDRGGDGKMADDRLTEAELVVNHKRHGGEDQGGHAGQHRDSDHLALDGQVLEGHYFLSGANDVRRLQQLGTDGQVGRFCCFPIDGKANPGSLRLEANHHSALRGGFDVADR